MENLLGQPRDHERSWKKIEAEKDFMDTLYNYKGPTETNKGHAPDRDEEGNVINKDEDQEKAGKTEDLWILQSQIILILV